MKSKYKQLIAALVIGLIIFSSHTFFYKMQIINTDYKIIANTCAELTLVANELILKEEWINDPVQKQHIENLLDIVYETSQSASGYTVDDKIYSDKFYSLNKYQDYAYTASQILKNDELTSKDAINIEHMNMFINAIIPFYKIE